MSSAAPATAQPLRRREVRLEGRMGSLNCRVPPQSSLVESPARCSPGSSAGTARRRPCRCCLVCRGRDARLGHGATGLGRGEPLVVVLDRQPQEARQPIPCGANASRLRALAAIHRERQADDHELDLVVLGESDEIAPVAENAFGIEHGQAAWRRCRSGPRRPRRFASRRCRARGPACPLADAEGLASDRQRARRSRPRPRRHPGPSRACRRRDRRAPARSRARPRPRRSRRRPRHPYPRATKMGLPVSTSAATSTTASVPRARRMSQVMRRPVGRRSRPPADDRACSRRRPCRRACG